MISFQDVVLFDQFVPDSTAVYSSPETYALLGSAEKVFLQLRSQQAAGTGNTTVTVDLQTAADAAATTWSTKVSAIVTGDYVATHYLFGNDAGSTPGGGLSRLKVTLAGTSPSAQIRITATGRVD